MPRARRTRYSVLGCLTVRPMSGYDIKRFMDGTLVHFWSESYGQIYPTLAKLEREGLVEGRQEPGARGRDRTVYRITESGRRALSEWLREPAEPAVPRHEHALKLFFGANVAPEVAVAHLERLRAEAREALARHREAEEELRQRAERQPASHAPYWLAVLRGGIRYAEMVLEWCEEARRLLGSLPPAAARDDSAARDSAERRSE